MVITRETKMILSHPRTTMHLWFSVNFDSPIAGDAMRELNLLVYNFFWVEWEMAHDEYEWEPWKITWVSSDSLMPRQVGLDTMRNLVQPPLMYQKLPYLEVRDDMVMVRRLTSVDESVFRKFSNKTDEWAAKFPGFVLPVNQEQNETAEEDDMSTNLE